MYDFNGVNFGCYKLLFMLPTQLDDSKCISSIKLSNVYVSIPSIN
jgi:hypothetical protein